MTDFLPEFVAALGVPQCPPPTARLLSSVLPRESGEGLFHVAQVEIPHSEDDLIFFVEPVTDLYYFKTLELANRYQSYIESHDPTSSIFFLREECMPSPSTLPGGWDSVYTLVGFRDDLASKANSATYGLRPGTVAHNKAKNNVNIEIVCTDDPVAEPVQITVTGQQFKRPRWSLRTTCSIPCPVSKPIELLLDYGDCYFDEMPPSIQHFDNKEYGSVIY